MQAPGSSPHTPYLALERITKSFPGVLANVGVTLEVRRGEIHALLGENGAGKSTLMKILYGFYKPDDGVISLEGRPLGLRSPLDAVRAGIGMVFQSFTLIPAFTVAENIALFLPELGVFLSPRTIGERLKTFGERYGLAVDPDARVWQLSVGQQQRVEIVKLLMSDARILILDEPTSVLAPQEVAGLFEILRTLRRDGYTVLVTTHKLKEVMAIADRVTVLRRGAVVGTAARDRLTESDLAWMMVGERDFDRDFDRRPTDSARPVLRLEDVSVRADRGQAGLRGLSFDVRAGEIVGVAGVTGNGQTELGETILGLLAPEHGRVVLDDSDITRWPTGRRLAAGVAYIPDDPLQMGLAPGLTVLENMVLTDRAHYLGRVGLLPDWLAIRRQIEEQVDNFGLAIPRVTVPTGTLSGGNVQRLVLLREVARRPKLLVAFHPTRGLDIAATRMAHELLIACRNGGAAILLVSEDLDELFAISDRLIVLARGALVGRFATRDVQPVDVGLLMTGGGRPAA